MSLHALARQPGVGFAAKTEVESPKPSTFEDAALMRAVRDGAPTAAAALHDRARPVVERTIRRLLRPADAEHDDLVQLALIELVYTIDRFRGECSLDAWISTISAHVAYKEIRRRQNARKVFAPLTPEEVDVPVASTRQMAHTALLRSVLERIRELLGEMDDQRAWTFVLHDVVGYDLKEVAQITSVSVAAAQSRLVRGRRELHEKIKADPELADELTHWAPFHS